MLEPQSDVLQGTLDLLVLKTLALGPMHGFGVSQRIRQNSQSVLNIQQGSLYPALRRLEQRRWIRAKWGVSDNNRKARFYELTPTGRKQLNVETQSWERLAAAVQQVLQTS
jgi:PadR family transcriptional regulator, regulatory protein PadR